MTKLISVVEVFVPLTLRDFLRMLPLAAIITAVGYYAIADTRPLVSVQTLSVSSAVPQGEFFRIDYRLEWASNCEVLGERFIIDSAGRTTIFDPDVRSVMTGPEEYSVQLRVPRDAAIGLAEYRGMVKYRCNWFQHFFPLERTVVTRNFEITEVPVGNVSMTCSADQPVSVRQHCRAMPSAR